MTMFLFATRIDFCLQMQILRRLRRENRGKAINDYVREYILFFFFLLR